MEATTISSFELRAIDGAALPTTLENAFGSILLPDEPLVPGGHYELRALTHCDGGAPDGGPSDAEHTATFTVAPASPMPTVVGTARVDYRRAVVSGRFGLSIDGARVSHGGPSATVAQITIEPSLELTPFLPITKFSVFVDGQHWASSHYGHGTDSYEPEMDVVTIRDFTRVHASCGRVLQTAACESPGAELGVHDVQIRAHIAGASSDPQPILLAIDLRCPEDPTLPDAAVDAGTSADPRLADAAVDAGTSADATVMVDAAVDAGTSADPTVMAQRSDEGGCSVSRHRSGSRATALWLIVGAFAFRIRRQLLPNKS